MYMYRVRVRGITFWQESSVYEAGLHEEGRQEEAHGRAEVDEGRGRAAVTPQIVRHACGSAPKSRIKAAEVSTR